MLNDILIIEHIVKVMCTISPFFILVMLKAALSFKPRSIIIASIAHSSLLRIFLNDLSLIEIRLLIVIFLSHLIVLILIKESSKVALGWLISLWANILVIKLIKTILKSLIGSIVV